ncbi:MAG: TatD family hydrolase [Gemmatimonadota bacterium]|nr:TatD family hydrolase [Gemmatimonadota bacterium]
MRLFDSHCHLTDAAYREDLEETLKRARAASVEGLVAVASTPGDSRNALGLARRHDGLMWSTAGVHPHHVTEAPGGDEMAAVRESAAHPRCVAIGETGLDYHYDFAPRAAQRTWFERHAELAGEMDLPLVVHSREAAEDTAAMVRECAGRVRGVLHCFPGPGELLEEALAAGWFVSFTGIITFRGYDAELVRMVPSDRYMIETDGPYLAPVPKRGRRNEPAFVAHVAGAVARIRGEPLEKVAADTWANAVHFFRLPEPNGER